LSEGFIEVKRKGEKERERERERERDRERHPTENRENQDPSKGAPSDVRFPHAKKAKPWRCTCEAPQWRPFVGG